MAMAKQYYHLNVSKECFLLFRNECKGEFIKHHPELKGTRITDDQLLNRIVQFYIKTPSRKWI